MTARWMKEKMRMRAAAKARGRASAEIRAEIDRRAAAAGMTREKWLEEQEELARQAPHPDAPPPEPFM